MHDAACATPAGDHPVKVSTNTNEFLFRVAERFGLPVVILLLVLWWARTDIVAPLLDAHFEAIDAIVRGQEKHSDQIEGLGRKLDELISINRSR